MKKTTFDYLKRLVMTVVVFMGCVSLSYAQGDWTLVSEEDLTSEVEKETSELLSSLPENYYANIPGSGSYGELKYNANYKENGIYPLYLISNGNRGDFFCIKSTLEPGEYRFTSGQNIHIPTRRMWETWASSIPRAILPVPRRYLWVRTWN